MAKAKKTKKEAPINARYDKILEEMEKKLSQSFNKLRKNMLKNAPINIIKKDSHDLLLLLGEANYLAKEAERIEKKLEK